jgi:hypothetical protein
MSEDFTPTSAADYPVVTESHLELPSGAKVIVKRPSVWAMLRRGQVPPEVREMMMRADSGEALTESENMAIMDCLVAAAFIAPKVSLKAKKGSVCIDDLPDEDRLAVVAALDLKQVI